MNVDPCKLCGAPMVWLTTVNGKAMPVNRAFFTERMTDAEFYTTPSPVYDHLIHKPYVHWKNCPHAKAFRKTRTKDMFL